MRHFMLCIPNAPLYRSSTIWFTYQNGFSSKLFLAKLIEPLYSLSTWKCSIGPLGRHWCMRYEAKHSYFNSLAKNAYNFKNIAKTLAKRHQHLMCYHLNSPGEGHGMWFFCFADSVSLAALGILCHIARDSRAKASYENVFMFAPVCEKMKNNLNIKLKIIIKIN